MNLSFETTTGENSDSANVSFNVSSDGELEDVEVLLGSEDITKKLSANEIEGIEEECWKHYFKECNEHNTDLAINRYLSSQEH
jgi:hypothetical protein